MSSIGYMGEASIRLAKFTQTALLLLGLFASAVYAQDNSDSPYANVAPEDSPYAPASQDSPYQGSTAAQDKQRLDQIAAQAEAARQAEAAKKAAQAAAQRAKEQEAAEEAAQKAATASQPSAAQQIINAYQQNFGVTGTATNSMNNAMCSTVQSQCATQTAACQGGSQSACYKAAACTCQAMISAGGCGSDISQLQDCVRENLNQASALSSNAPVFDPNKTGSSYQPQPGYTPPPTTPSRGGGCAPGSTACGAY